jgi:hypothetical protein
MGVGAVHCEHRHSLAGGEKIPVVGGEAETTGAAGGTAAASVTASSSRKLLPNIARRLLVPNGCTPVGVRLKPSVCQSSAACARSWTQMTR